MGARVLVMLLAVLITAGFLASANRVSAQSCGVDLSDLRSKCLKYAMKMGAQKPPSDSCCAAVKTIDIPCACKFITDDVLDVILDFISAKKAVSVARSCGKNLSPGTKCGSFTVPPA